MREHEHAGILQAGHEDERPEAVDPLIGRPGQESLRLRESGLGASVVGVIPVGALPAIPEADDHARIRAALYRKRRHIH